MADFEKKDVETGVIDSDSGAPSGLAQMSEEEIAKLDRKLVLKLDLILVPIVAMFYLLAFLDRANIGNARVVCSILGYDFMLC